MNTPISPWERPVQSPVSQTLFGPGAISLKTDVTYLDAVGDPADPPVHDITMPDGNYARQIKRIFILKKNEVTTAKFRLSGTFVEFETLLFDKIGHAAVLEWDGGGWHLMGGNATPEN